MKIIRRFSPLVLLLVGALAAAGAASPKDAASRKPNQKLPPEVTSFAAAKEQQAKELAQKLNVKVSPDVWAFFTAAKKGDAAKVASLWEKLRKRAGQYEGSWADPTCATPVWSTVLETELAAEQFSLGEPKYAVAFGRDIINSIPAGSIYFGGTDPGRGLVTTLSKSHAQADPFFTLTQNALADGNYLAYLRAMYGARLYMPSAEDSQRCFQEYLADAQQRLKEGKLKTGEDVKEVDNRVTVSGQVAVMSINALLAKVVFDKNPDREFFIEESFPLDWMYPHLVPHGLILKIERKPLETIPPAAVTRDREFWNQQMREMLGDWLQPDTSVRTVCDFAERVFVHKDLAGFSGDPKFVRSDYACKMYSKLRSSIAGVYAWRANDTKAPEEQQRMREAADFAFRQAFALCPCSPEAVFRYVTLLVQEKRVDDAQLIAQTAAKLDPDNGQIKALIQQLKEMGKRGA